MKINHKFICFRADKFAVHSEPWTRLIGRSWDREPMLSCHEWTVTDSVLFRVPDSNQGHNSAPVTLLDCDLDGKVECLSEAGIEVPEPGEIDGFDTLRFATFADPEGNTVGLFDGS